MGALVHTETSRFAAFKGLEATFKPIETPSESHVRAVGAVLVLEQHEFPEAFKSRPLPVVIRDETLEFYAFVFCQGGFRQLGMTFEQFLLVAAAIKPADLPACGHQSRPRRAERLLSFRIRNRQPAWARTETCRVAR